ncbi:hypothetical protein J4436_01990 [Candidatus Woesearchaeota archaeon]|nr:hypothetical protein [Candidatus Woesearchaeota archaeon]
MSKREELEKQINIIENISFEKMTKDAIGRYHTLKSMHPEKAIKVISLIAQKAQEITNKITDEQFKNILLSIEPKKEFKIRRL